MDENAPDATETASALEGGLAIEGEAALVARARAGERAAFEAIVRQHSAAVYRIVAGHLGGAEAEDATQETFVQVLRGLPAFRGGSQLGTWVFRIATNVALKRIRRRRLLRRARSLEEEEHAPAAKDAPPGTALDASERAAAMRGAIAKLPEDQRAVVVLRAIEGLSFEAVARTLGILKPTAESRMARARERLRALLAPWLEDEPSSRRPASAPREVKP